MKQEISEYEKQADDFLKKTGTTIDIKYIGLTIPEHWGEDEKRHKTYEVTLFKDNLSYSFNFWDSIHNTKTLGAKPSEYDVLACLNVDYSDDLKDFCDTFGYYLLTDSIKELARIKKVYEMVKKETENLKRLFSDKELDLLGEIA